MTETGVSAMVTVTIAATSEVSDGQSARTAESGGEEHEGELARLRQSSAMRMASVRRPKSRASRRG